MAAWRGAGERSPSRTVERKERSSRARIAGDRNEIEAGVMDQFIGTMPVAEKQRFDVARLDTYLRAQVEGFAGSLEVEQFKGGVQSDLSAERRRQALCDAHQARA